MMTVGDLKLILDDFSDNDLVEAYEFGDTEHITLSNVLGIFRAKPQPPGKLPICGGPIGYISTTIGKVTVFTEGEESYESNPLIGRTT